MFTLISKSRPTGELSAADITNIGCLLNTGIWLRVLSPESLTDVVRLTSTSSGLETRGPKVKNDFTMSHVYPTENEEQRAEHASEGWGIDLTGMMGYDSVPITVSLACVLYAHMTWFPYEQPTKRSIQFHLHSCVHPVTISCTTAPMFM